MIVRTLWSGISRGTERLVFNGTVPQSEFDRMRAPFQEGAFPFPVKYGYCNVGRVEEGPQALVGKEVFSLFPHQEWFRLPSDCVLPIPEHTPARRAILAANMETALNGIWDGKVGPGDRITVVGAGVLGGLIAGICSTIPGAEVTLVDIAPQRAELAARLEADFVLSSEISGSRACEADIVFHTSASDAGLQTALDCAGREAMVVEMSWYGSRSPVAPLGEAFHSRRLTLRSSQVGQIPPDRAARWTYRRRLAKALDLLADPKYDALITNEVAFDALPDAIPSILGQDTTGLASVVRYEA
ncbi:MAG: zinc-binding alcohol dehydrogenase [Neomegalonema sp.]|nr:zinc-binding alcohol dehydrogenase [Neomegalonema sp.]